MGGYAIISGGKAAAYPWDNEEFAEICRLLEREGEPVMDCVEQVASRSEQGVKGIFTFGKAAGYIEGVLIACEIGFQLVPPQKWKKEFTLIGKDKGASIAVCKRLFPGVNLKRTDKCRTDSDGMAEALLMAEYARRNWR